MSIIKLKLEKIRLDMEKSYLCFIDEWKKYNEKIIPVSAQLDGEKYSEFVAYTKNMETNAPSGFVNATTLFLTLDDEIIGAISIRHSLNKYLFDFGGHIGYGIKPSKRKCGYAKSMVKMSFQILKELGLTTVLITCYTHNIGSAKTIESLGGILENISTDENNIQYKRYWLDV